MPLPSHPSQRSLCLSLILRCFPPAGRARSLRQPCPFPGPSLSFHPPTPCMDVTISRLPVNVTISSRSCAKLGQVTLHAGNTCGNSHGRSGCFSFLLLPLQPACRRAQIRQEGCREGLAFFPSLACNRQPHVAKRRSLRYLHANPNHQRGYRLNFNSTLVRPPFIPAGSKRLFTMKQLSTKIALS